ncbi:MAG: hypothetical protein CENE_01478 [Candidatus Celerinatantimonas neptuna]|nr:MAG: hypothetical protein CENE_01478 [Candidatus Celerinatantimonas neptuna]
MKNSIWHHRTQAGEQCLQQDQPGMALIHYLAAMEQARYWVKNLNDELDSKKCIEAVSLFLRSCLNLVRYWYIQSDPNEQQRYLLEATNYQTYLGDLSQTAKDELQDTLYSYYKSLCKVIEHHPELDQIEKLRCQADLLQSDLKIITQSDAATGSFNNA